MLTETVDTQEEDAMATAEERMRILKMVEEGKISPDEGAKLLAALGRGARTSGASARAAVSNGRWLRVRVTDVASGKVKVNVNLPLGLLNAALTIGARFAPEIGALDIDEIVDAIRGGAEGRVIDVTDEDGERVEIFVD